MVELFGNLAKTTINQVGGINATSTTVVVSALNGSNTWNSFPSSGNFRVVFGTDNNAEIAICTAVDTTSNTLTLLRGQEGSTAQTWGNGTAVTLAITAASINQTVAEAYQVGPYSNLPAQGRATGSFYQAIDGHTPWSWNPYTGSWQPVIGGVLGIKPPSAATFTGQNNSTGTLTDTGRGALLYTGVQDAGPTFRGYSISQSGPGFVEAAVQMVTGGTSSAGDSILGVSMLETSTGKAYQFDITVQHSSIQLLVIEVFSALGTRSAVTSFPQPQADANGPLFLRVRRDLTNLFAEYSRDRIFWKQMDTRTIASVFTSAPNTVCLSGYGNGLVPTINVLSFNYGPYPSQQHAATMMSHATRTLVSTPPPVVPPPPVTAFVNTILRS